MTNMRYRCMSGLTLHPSLPLGTRCAVGVRGALCCWPGCLLPFVGQRRGVAIVSDEEDVAI